MTKFGPMPPLEIRRALNALRVTVMMLNGECQHGYNTAHSARGCDLCAEQIEDALEVLENWPEGVVTEGAAVGSPWGSPEQRMALDATQDLPRMVAFVTDMRTQVNPMKAVEYFNQYFPDRKSVV